MSVKMSSWVWEHSGAAGTDLLILLALADVADDTGVCWPSLATLAGKTKVHEATVRRRLRALRKLGLVGWDEQPGRPNRFRIITDTPLQIATPTPAQSAPPANRKGSHLGATPTPSTQVQGAPSTQVLPEPSITSEQPPEEKVGVVIAEDDIPKGTRTPQPLPKPFIVTAEMRAWARKTTPGLDVNAVTAEFVAYWREGEGKGKRKKNWTLTWQNWLKRRQGDQPVTPIRREIPKNEEWMYK